MNIVDIPTKMQKFYGSGKMLHPDIDMIKELLLVVPYGKVTLIDSICEKMAFDESVKVTCPMRTGNAIKKISEEIALDDSQNLVPFWRIIRKNHLLINSPFKENCAAKLKNEGFKVDKNPKGEYKVCVSQKQLFHFM